MAVVLGYCLVMEPHLRVQLCGRVTLTGPSRSVDQRECAGGLGRQVIAMLTLSRAPVGRQRLIDAIWEGRPPRSVDSTVNATVSRLRAAIRSAGCDADFVLRSESNLLEFAPGVVESDVQLALGRIDRSERLLVAGDLVRARIDATVAHSAIARTLLPGIEREWLDDRREQLEALRTRAVNVLAVSTLKAGDTRYSLALATEHHREHRFDDRAVVLLVAALIASNELSGGRSVVDRWARDVEEEFGHPPLPETLRALRHAVQTGSHDAVSKLVETLVRAA